METQQLVLVVEVHMKWLIAATVDFYCLFIVVGVLTYCTYGESHKQMHTCL